MCQVEEEPEQTSQRDTDDALTADDLPRIQEEVDELQRQFDVAVAEKHALEQELQSMRERLKACADLTDRYRVWAGGTSQSLY